MGPHGIRAISTLSYPHRLERVYVEDVEARSPSVLASNQVWMPAPSAIRLARHEGFHREVRER
jgi:hypothetical protein